MNLEYIKWRLKYCCHLFPPTKYLIRKRRSRIDDDAGLESQRRALQEQGPAIARKAVAALKDAGVDAVLSYGNLLGIVREGSFLAHDDDLDLAFCLTDDSVWPGIEAAMKDAGFEKIRQFEYHGAITEQAYFLDGLGVDVFGFHVVPGSGKLRGYFYNRYWDTFYPSPADHTVKYCDVVPFIEAKWVSVDGVDLPIPDNAEEWLSVFYGKGWATPDPGWNSASGWDCVSDFGQCTLLVR